MSLTAKLDKTTYKPGDTMTLTVTTAAGERQPTRPVAVHVDVPGIGFTDLTGVLDLPDLPIAVTDPNRSWTLAADDGTKATYTATA